MTHATAKWAWPAERSGGRHVLRLSYDRRPDHPVAQATADAETLLGTRIGAVIDGAVTEWSRPVGVTHAVDGMHQVGEAGPSTGLAAVVASARATAGRILATGDPAEPPS
ncbi:MAG: hypothetical protein HY996_09110 [Micrococcales bacterium]|nr:hypothetical protein [Micrococcales bacterium]